jgi:hypothetical protein
MKLNTNEICKYKDICKYNSNAYNVPCYGALENRNTIFICNIWEEKEDGLIEDRRPQTMD